VFTRRNVPAPRAVTVETAFNHNLRSRRSGEHPRTQPGPALYGLRAPIEGGERCQANSPRRAHHYEPPQPKEGSRPHLWRDIPEGGAVEQAARQKYKTVWAVADEDRLTHLCRDALDPYATRYCQVPRNGSARNRTNAGPAA